MGTRSHIKFVARTILVKNNDPEKALNFLDRLLRRENIFKEYRDYQRYIKPTEKRRQISYERSKRIYNADMQKRIEFAMQKNRRDPFPR